MEIWKTIKNFSRYEISSLGNIRSINYKNSGRVKNLKPTISEGYYKTMLLDDDGNYKTRRIHKLVAITFINEINDKTMVNHKDGNKLNNKVENLEFCNNSENIKHAHDNKLIKPKTGKTNGNSKLTEEDVIEIRNYVANSPTRYYGRKELAKNYNISEAHLKDIISGRRNIWSHIK